MTVIQNNKPLLDLSLDKPLEDVVISYDSERKPYSKYGDNAWFITEHNFKVSFDRLSGDFRAVVKDIVYRAVTDTSLRSCKSAVANIIEGAVVFQRSIWLCGGSDYSFLESELHYRKVIEKAKSRGLRYKTWKNNLIFLSWLKSCGYLKRELGQANKLAEYLAGGSTYSKQTMAIPENIASIYFRDAINVVEKFHPHRHKISELYEAFVTEYMAVQLYAKTNVQCRQAALKKVRGYRIYEIELDFSGIWLSWLRGACYIVLAAFTGCRDGEIKSLNLSSYEEKEYADIKIPILKGFDTKPNVGGVQRPVSWVTIPAAKKAIELLWDAFSFAREIWKETANTIVHADEKDRFLKDINSLFISIPSSVSTKPRAGRQAIDKSLKNYVKSIGYKATARDVKEFNLLNPTRIGELNEGEVLNLHPHAFRRTFAVYLVRNKLGSLLDLKYQFKHMNIAMSSWYSNHAHLAAYFDMMMDSELQAEIAEENNNYMTDTLYFVYNEAETLAGPEGKRILDLRANSTSTIYLSREEIAQQVKEGRLSIIEHPTGHCTNPRCDRVCDMTTCQYKLVTKDKALDLMQVRERLISKFYALTDAKVNQPNILSKFYFEIRAIEKVLEEHNISYSKFSADISVSLL